MKDENYYFIYGIALLRIIELVGLTLIGFLGGAKLANYLNVPASWSIFSGCLFFALGMYRFITSLRKYMK